MEENGENRNFFLSLDYIRLIAIGTVILLHTVTGVTDNYSNQMTQVQLSVYTAIKYLCEMGVPLFLMVSGALMLDPARKLTWEKLHRKYIRRLVLALVIFGTLFALAEGVYNCCFGTGWKTLAKTDGLVGTLASQGRIGRIAGLVLDSLKKVFTGDSWAHLWYMYVIIGIYLILPFLRSFVEKADEKTYGQVLLLLVLMQAVVPSACKLVGIKSELTLPVKGIYLTYFLLGYYVWKYRPFEDPSGENKKTLKKIGILMAVYAVVTAFNPEAQKITYASPTVFFLSLAVFVRCISSEAEKRNNSVCSNKFLLSIRKLSFGMYLVHTVFLNFCYKVLKITPLLCGGYILIPVIFLLTFLFAYICAWIMKKLPWFGKNVV